MRSTKAIKPKIWRSWGHKTEVQASFGVGLKRSGGPPSKSWEIRGKPPTN